MVDFPLRSVDKEVHQLKLTAWIITERGGVCCSRNLNNLTACLRIYSNSHYNFVNTLPLLTFFSDQTSLTYTTIFTASVNISSILGLTIFLL